MTERTGQISVQTNDVFPIIKKWLYSEHDIFIRELVANATDAISKRSSLARVQNNEIPKGAIDIVVNKTKKIITITDNGLGMTEEEVEKYIAQLAFSGAEEFIQKMEETDKSNDIIGKFGLGFYSSFMVSDKVELESLSMKEGAKAVKWSCKGDPSFTFSESDKAEVGTTITLHINKESEEFLSVFSLNTTLKKFCNFMPFQISVLDEEKVVYPKKEDGSDDTSAAPLPNTPEIINETTPLWKRNPKDVTDDEYIKFYQSQFPMEQAPLFWIHLKVDHPFTLEGLLYFPKLNPNKPFNESNIKLYCKQVFVSDNVKNIIPEFLSLLKGTIDSSDIPLNVSRSSLQGDPNIRKISNYIIKKVAESLKKLFKKDREKYEQIWEDVGLFIKYGCVSDTKFDELMRDKVIFKNAENKYMTLGEYRESIPTEFQDKLKDKVLYCEKNQSNGTVRKQLLESSIQSIETDDHIDPHFIQHVETNKQEDQTLQFTSVESEVANLLSTENTTDTDIKIKDLFTNILSPVTEVSKEEEGKTPEDPSKLEVIIEKIKNSTSPAYIKFDEQMKRFNRMTLHMSNNSFPLKKTLVINPGHPLIQNAMKIHETGNNEELVKKICHHVEDLANISSQGLNADSKDLFVQRSQELIQDLTNFAV